MEKLNSQGSAASLPALQSSWGLLQEETKLITLFKPFLLWFLLYLLTTITLIFAILVLEYMRFVWRNQSEGKILSTFGNIAAFFPMCDSVRVKDVD